MTAHLAHNHVPDLETHARVGGIDIVGRGRENGRAERQNGGKDEKLFHHGLLDHISESEWNRSKIRYTAD